MNSLKLNNMNPMNPEEEEKFWKEFTQQLAYNDDDAVKARLAAGLPVYYSDDQYPKSIIRQWPDGRREIVEINEKTGDVINARPL